MSPRPDVRRGPVNEDAEEEALAVLREEAGLMETFALTGPYAGFTGELADMNWVNGECKVPAEDAEKYARILCRYYGAVRKEDVQMKVLIYGPINQNEWAQHARTTARLQWPSCTLLLHHPAEFKGIEDPPDPQLKNIHALIVVQGCEYISDAYSQVGISEIVTLPAVIYTEQEAEPSPPDLPDEEDDIPVDTGEEKRGVYQHQAMIDRLLEQTVMKLRRSIQHPDIVVLFQDVQFVQHITKTEQAGQNRSTVLRDLTRAAKG